MEQMEWFLLTDGDQADISVERYDDVNTIASVLKLYFRLLPIPLITFDIYFKLIDTIRESYSLDFVFMWTVVHGRLVSGKQFLPVVT